MNRTKRESENDVEDTLHNIIQDWVNQPWNGDRYLNIAEQLWDSLEAADLFDGPFGTSATLLQSCIFNATEGLNVGSLDEEQAVKRLADLLGNTDFAEGTRVIEVRPRANPDIKIANMDQLKEENQTMDFRIPFWWKRSVRSYWLLIGVVPFVAMLIVYIMLVNLELLLASNTLAYVVVTPLGFASAYYIRTVPSRRIWRAIFILMGSCFIGIWFIALPLALLIGPRFSVMPWWLRMPWLLIVSMVSGGLIGDWLGRRNDYRPCM
ncbi:MAG: hypothetical protein ACE5H4_01210 [Candidatus Thorarchaeota archaeon]